MKNVSDIIEEFILNQLLSDPEVSLSRNELAMFFNCAPSQINYVLSTRFTPVRGFDTESKRGGGGFIKVYKLSSKDQNTYLYNLANKVIGNEIDYTSSLHVLDNLKFRLYITEGEYNVIKSAISDRALASPIRAEGKTRAKILKNIIIDLQKGE